MLRHLWWVLGLVLVVGGVVLVLSTRPDSAEFGWFAYTPLSEDPDWTMGCEDSSGSTLLLVSWWQLAGAALAAAGLAIVAAAIGFRLGRRRT